MMTDAIHNGTVLNRDKSQLIVGAAQRASYNWAAELAIYDFPWVVNLESSYSSALRKMPSIFSWEESDDAFVGIQAFARSTAVRRLQSFFRHMSLYAPNLAQSMFETFDALPSAGKLRFMTAPLTFANITSLRREPSVSVMNLCTFLNGEAALHGAGAAKVGYYTALGDAYYRANIEASAPVTIADELEVSRTVPFLLKAPCLVDDIPIDFFSPNVQHAKLTSGSEMTKSLEYGDYSDEEVARVSGRLQEALCLVGKVSTQATQLIREFVKVVIPLKVGNGVGSTSQPRFPGRVLVRGIERSSPASIASALIHESIHQLLYILEWGGEFVMPPAQSEEKPKVQSLWTGRDLVLHSFIHACFVWYGLARFWSLPTVSEAFEKGDIDTELTRCLSGFMGANPIQVLEPHAGRLRYDVTSVAATLQGRLTQVIERSRAHKDTAGCSPAIVEIYEKLFAQA
jgi:hypothetical protein